MADVPIDDRLVDPGAIRIGAKKTTPARHDAIDGTQFRPFDLIKKREDRFLERHGHIAAPPVRVDPARFSMEFDGLAFTPEELEGMFSALLISNTVVGRLRV